MEQQLNEQQPYVGPETDTFHANGHKYIIYKSLNIARYREYERLQVMAGFGAEYSTLFNGMKKAYSELNTMKAADASVTLFNLMEGTARKMNKSQNTMLLMCTLFINREGEDLTKWTEPEANEKIADWEAAGLDIQGFFRLYLRWARNFEGGLLSDLSTTSGIVQEENGSLTDNPQRDYFQTSSEVPTFSGSNS